MYIHTHTHIHIHIHIYNVCVCVLTVHTYIDLDLCLSIYLSIAIPHMKGVEGVKWHREERVAYCARRLRKEELGFSLSIPISIVEVQRGITLMLWPRSAWIRGWHDPVSMYWPSQDIVSLQGFCARANHPFLASPSALPTLLQYDCTAIAQYTTPPQPPLYMPYTTQNRYWQYPVKAKCCIPARCWLGIVRVYPHLCSLSFHQDLDLDLSIYLSITIQHMEGVERIEWHWKELIAHRARSLK